MKIFYQLILMGVAIGFCSTCSRTAANSGTAPERRSAVNAPANSNVTENRTSDPTVNAENTSLGPLQTRDKRFNRVNRPIAPIDPSATPVPLKFHPAGEDSQVAVTMKPDGRVYEVRVFKSHPQFAKIEATWVDGKTKDLEIQLRDGRILKVRTDQIANLQTAPTKDLLAIAGLK